MWKIVDGVNFKNAGMIFPTQQRDVNLIVNTLSMDGSVRKIVVFGSSVTSACNPWSDIDLYVELSAEKNIRAPRVEVPVDLWTNYDVDERLLAEIEENGVVVWEQ